MKENHKKLSHYLKPQQFKRPGRNDPIYIYQKKIVCQSKANFFLLMDVFACARVFFFFTLLATQNLNYYYEACFSSLWRLFSEFFGSFSLILSPRFSIVCMFSF